MSRRTPAIGRTKYSIMPLVSGWLTSKRYSSPSQTRSMPACSCVRDDDARGVGQRLLGGRRNEPVGYRVRADGGGLDAAVAAREALLR